jgi:methionyl-tRNA formyltransferase
MRVVFMGSSAASAECLRALLREECLEVVGIVTQPDRPVGRGKQLAPCPLAKFAADQGFTEVIKPEKVNDDEPMARIRAWNPDVVAVVAFGQILKKPLLDLPPHGCVNCHFSLLPKYRGAAPVIAALEAGDRKTGVTVMHMGVGLDDGPIMLQSYEPIYPDTTGGMLMDDLSIAGGVALAKALRLMARGELPPEVPQDGKYATHVKKLRKTDGLIVWDAPVIEIERRIRAYNPWPGCFTFLPERFRKKGNSGRLVVTKAKIVNQMAPGWAEVPPGKVLKLDKAGPIIRCHDTALQLLEVKPEGGSLMDGGAFLRGRPLKPLEDFL